jgi:hypothetical protein
MKNALEIAKQYCEEGLYPIPVQYKGKKPTVPTDWTNLKVTPDNAEQYFNGKETNIGILLGDGLIDIDIDDERLLGLAKDILPPSGLVFGRASKRSSHYLYKSDHQETKKYTFGNKTLIEIRSKGCQTVVPPSTHIEGEVITWERRESLTKTSSEQITQYVGLLAFTSIILNYYPSKSGERNDVCDAITGVLLRASFGTEDIDTTVTFIAQHCGDEEYRKRAKAKTIKKNLDEKKKVLGLPALQKLLELQNDDINKIREFLNISKKENHEPLKFLSYFENVNTPIPKPNWLIPGLIMKNTVFMISGFGGSGKSSLSVLLGITGAHHLKSFMGRDVPYPFSTLIMNQEDTMDQLRLKASAYKKHFKLTKPILQGEIFENTDQKICDITFVSGAEKKFTLGKFTKDILIPSPHYEEIRNKVLKKNIDLIIVDPFILLFEGINENEASHVSTAMKLLLELGAQTNAAVIVIDHISKASLNIDIHDDINNRQAATKGSINKMSAARGGLLLTHMSKKDARSVFNIEENTCTDYIHVLDAKNNYAAIKIEGSWLKKDVVQVDDAECMILVDDHELAKSYAKNKEGKKNRLKDNIFECWDILLGLFDGNNSIAVNYAASAVMNEPCFEQVAPGTVTYQIKNALKKGIYNKGVTLKYFFDHSATKTKHIIKKEEDLENVPF